MLVRVLHESYQGWDLGHWTNLNGLIGILKDNELKGNSENRLFLAGKTTVSFSRVKGKPTWVNYPGWVKIVIDAGKLEEHYQMTPFEYWTNPEEAKDKEEFKSERAKGKSEFEIAVVLADTIQTAFLRFPKMKKPVGSVKINMFKQKFISVKDRYGEEVKPDSKGYYNFSNIKEVADKKYKITLVRAEDVSMFGDGHTIIFDLKMEDEDGNINIIPNKDFESAEIEGITDFKDYIKRVEFPSFMVRNGQLIDRDDIVIIVTSNVGGAFDTLKKYFGAILKDGHTDGFNKTKQRHISHDKKTYSKFIKFINTELKGKISTYKVSDDWIGDNDTDYDAYEKNFVKNNYIDESNSNINDNPVYCVEYKLNDDTKSKYAFISALSKNLAKRVILPKFIKNNSNVREASIVPYEKKYFKEYSLKVAKNILTSEGDIYSLYSLVKDNAEVVKKMETLLIITGGKSKKLKDIISFEYDDSQRGSGEYKGGIYLKM